MYPQALSYDLTTDFLSYINRFDCIETFEPEQEIPYRGAAILSTSYITEKMILRANDAYNIKCKNE